MRVAVTGGTGFIGRPLVEALIQKGHQVRVLARNPDKVQVKGASARFFDADKPVRPDALEDIQAVIHLAGETISKQWTNAYKEVLRRSRINGTKAIAEAVAAREIQTFISASGVGFYGDRPDEELDESSSGGTDFLAMLCQGWEAAAAAAKLGGARVVTPRIGMVLHPEGGALKKMLLPFKLGLGGRAGSGDQWISWIHRDDLVSLLVFALENKALSGPVNATSPNPVTNLELAKALGHALGRPTFLPEPAFALKLLLGEMSTLLLKGQFVLPKKAVAAGFRFAYPVLEDALAHLLAA